MKTFILPLREACQGNQSSVGNKAAALGRMLEQGLRIPQGLCISRHAYDAFIRDTGIDQQIIVELGRKRFEDMRWEEIWDASLRIRNMFTKTAMPEELQHEIVQAIHALFADRPLAIRSSSLAEDSPGASFAGMHESFINISDPEKIIQSVQLVWASLWSDAALLYRKELKLETGSSAMAVIIQEMIAGQASGIAFCVDPNNDKQAVIESVYGLNQGLVDGDIEPDRFFIDRTTGSIISALSAHHDRRALPVAGGVRIVTTDATDALSITDNQVSGMYAVMQQLEKLFEAPQDIEWTIKGDDLYVLQSRPITTKGNDEKEWYLSLRRSLDNLQGLADRIENTILPDMEKESTQIAAVDLSVLPDDGLAQELEKRKQAFARWKEVYWNECIPFAHGVRLFATIYNDRMHPEDPYEFIETIAPADMKSLERNRHMDTICDYIHTHPQSFDERGEITNDTYLRTEIDQFIQELKGAAGDDAPAEQANGKIITMLREMAGKASRPVMKKASQQREKAAAFIAAFSNEDKEYAQQLISIAEKSYRLRDDDNIYLGKVETNLSMAMQESCRRLGSRCNKKGACLNPEEVITALKFPDYMPQAREETIVKQEKVRIQARQLRGQPAGKGIARGKARVVLSHDDLFAIQKDEIIVCDAIDPTMTFVIPLASAIVERRGGMLIHGAIIAREYGIPCVTGIPQATEFIQTGDSLTVDGYYGLVTNHSRTLKA